MNMDMDESYTRIYEMLSKYIKVKPDAMYAYNEHFNALATVFLGNIQEDPNFNNLYGGCSLQGSSGDDLKVGKPNEFDMVFYILIPYPEHIIVVEDFEIPGNVHLDMTVVLEYLRLSETSENIFQWLKSLVNNKNQLIVQKFQSWLQGIVTRVLNRMSNRFDFNGRVCQLSYKTCGPAHTIYVNGYYKYSVDFVPAIRLKAEKNILGPNESIYFQNQTHWDAIPKPVKPFRADSTSFRCSYYDAEKVMIENKNECKNAIMLMKKFRDVKTNLSFFKSYYFKVLFLRKIAVNSNTKWHTQSITVILTEMFEELKICLSLGELPFFWHPKLNMLKVLTPEQLKEMFKVVENTTKIICDMTQRETAHDIWRDLVFTFTEKKERQQCDLFIRRKKKTSHSFVAGIHRMVPFHPYYNSRNIDGSNAYLWSTYELDSNSRIRLH